PERKSRIISEREKAITAYHEVGHALVARMLPNVDPVHKISIIARGMMGGYTRVLPGEDRYMWSKSQFKDNLAFALGGRAAEEIPTTYKNKLMEISELLIDKETLDAPDFEALFEGIPRPEPNEVQAPQRQPRPEPAVQPQEPAKPQKLPELKPGMATFSQEQR